MQYLGNNDVKLFPSSMRSGYDVYSRFTTELNLVDIVNRVSSGKFVTGTFSEGGNTWVDFTLLGYRFNINIQSLSSGSIYAVAIVGYSDNETRYDSILKGYDGAIQNRVDDGPNTPNKFIGLQITTSESECTTFKSNVENTQNWNIKCDYILLGTKVGSTFNVNPDLSTLNIETLSTQDIDTAWNNATA